MYLVPPSLCVALGKTFPFSDAATDCCGEKKKFCLLSAVQKWATHWEQLWYILLPVSTIFTFSFLAKSSYLLPTVESETWHHACSIFFQHYKIWKYSINIMSQTMINSISAHLDHPFIKNKKKLYFRKLFKNWWYFAFSFLWNRNSVEVINFEVAWSNLLLSSLTKCWPTRRSMIEATEKNRKVLHL